MVSITLKTFWVRWTYGLLFIGYLSNWCIKLDRLFKTSDEKRIISLTFFLFFKLWFSASHTFNSPEEEGAGVWNEAVIVVVLLWCLFFNCNGNLKAVLMLWNGRYPNGWYLDSLFICLSKDILNKDNLSSILYEHAYIEYCPNISTK